MLFSAVRRSILLAALLCTLLASRAYAASTTTTLEITASGNPATTAPAKSAITLSATVSNGNPVTAGQVNFYDATFTFVPGIGNHLYKTVFVGTSSNTTSSSTSSSLTITGIYPTATSIGRLQRRWTS
jgi:hypothetical protein